MNAKTDEKKSGVVVPILLVAVGVGWLLTNLGFVPGIEWAWSLGLIAGGILTLVIRGLNKGSIVIGPFLIICGLLSIARQSGMIDLKIEIPCLVIAIGALLLISRLSNLPSGLEGQ